jgi:hypothetical protein
MRIRSIRHIATGDAGEDRLGGASGTSLQPSTALTEAEAAVHRDERGVVKEIQDQAISRRNRCTAVHPRGRQASGLPHRGSRGVAGTAS